MNVHVLFKRPPFMWEMQWPNGYCIGLWIAVWLRVLTGVIVLCSWARTLTLPLSTQEYNGELLGQPDKMLALDLSIPPRGSSNTPSRLRAMGNWDKLQQCGPV